MIVITHQKNFCPETFVQRMLSLNNGQIIAGRDHTAVQNDEVTVARRRNNGLQGATTDGDADEEDGGVIKNFTLGAKSHGSVSDCGYRIYSLYSTNDCRM